MTKYKPISLLILVLNKLLIPFQKITLKNKVTVINAEMIAKLQLLLSGESGTLYIILIILIVYLTPFIVPF
jgi:hypothetical protein